jgi:hypothetical protein
VDDWRQRANCRDIPTSEFYRARGEMVSEHVRQACGACEVSAECLDWALHHELVGYWAGTSGRQRERLRRERGVSYVPLSVGDDSDGGVQSHGTDASYRRHVRRQEDACAPCLAAHRAYDRERKERRKWRDAEAAS